MAAGLKAIKSICRYFPPVQLAFAYGSAVFRQQGREMGKMLDLAFVVDDSEGWHTENLARHSSHYSFLKYFGPSIISKVQQLSAGVYYNTLVKVDGQLLKYGVTSKADFLRDLTKWEWLYLSGRLHKPVLLLTDCEDKDLHDALNYNLRSALLCAALLINKPSFTLEELFLKITGLSYTGDFRMVVGEDRNKIKNVVTPNMQHFKTLYMPFITTSSWLSLDNQNPDIIHTQQHFSLDQLQHNLPEKLLQQLNTSQSLEKCLATIVGASSKRQSLKGIATAGVTKSVYYAAEKMQKMLKSL